MENDLEVEALVSCDPWLPVSGLCNAQRVELDWVLKEEVPIVLAQLGLAMKVCIARLASLE
jgi:hypothetical protein